MKAIKSMQIINKKTLLGEIDLALGRGPPAIEYIYVTPYRLNWTLFNRKITGNPYGHACLRYTLEDKQYLMNIVGIGGKMVHLLSPDDYLFTNTIDGAQEGNEQGGVFQRSFVGFRVENWEQEKIREMHDFFLHIQEQSDRGKMGYSTFLGPILWSLFPNATERGNCSYWTSKGMAIAGLFDHPTLWPKFIFTKLYFSMRKRHSNFNIVFYDSVEKLKEKESFPGWLKPFMRFFDKIFSNLRRFANVVVGFDNDGENYVGKIQKNPYPFRPFL